MTNLAAFCRQLYQQAPDGPLLLALSGGLDSSLLLRLLVDAGLSGRLHVIHVDHQLQRQSDHWQRFCERQVREYSLPYYSQRVEVDQREGLEAGARDARYGALLGRASTLQASLITAHHRDDQAETLLFRLLRGAGVQGLSAIRERTEQQGVTLWRPLLGIARKTLEHWAGELGVQWQDDPSNQNQALRRNYLRHTVLPVLRKPWPGVDATLARTAEHMAEAAELLEQVAAEDGQALAIDGDVFPLAGLGMLSLARQRNVMRWWLRLQGATVPSAAVLEQILGLQQAAADSQAKVEWGSHGVRLYRGALFLGTQRTFAPWQDALLWREGDLPPALPGWQWCQEAGNGHITVMRPAGDLWLRPLSGAMAIKRNGMHQQIKELWRAAGVPPWQRRQWPLLCRGNETVSVPALGLADGEAEDRAERWFLIPRR